MRNLRYGIYAVAALIVVTLGATESRKIAAESKKANAAQARAAQLKRGEYMVTIGGCDDCHTPLKMGPKGPEPDMTRRLSGHPEDLKMPEPPAAKGPWIVSAAGTNTAWAGPWGVSYTRNLTPEPLTGIGIWTEEMFIKTIRSGKHWGVSRPILPPMPWFNYAKMTDEDIKAVYAYLRTIPPVKNQVPDAILAPPPPQVAAK